MQSRNSHLARTNIRECFATDETNYLCLAKYRTTTTTIISLNLWMSALWDALIAYHSGAFCRYPLSKVGTDCR